MMIVIFTALLALPILNWSRGSITEYRPLAVAAPAFTLLSLNILGKLGFGALGGFEYVAILAGECRDPVRTINRSVIIAAPIIAVMFILRTSSVLALVRPDDIDLIGPIPQVLSIGSRPFGIAASVVPVAILMVMCMRSWRRQASISRPTRGCRWSRDGITCCRLGSRSCTRNTGPRSTRSSLSAQ